jgi:hypothetical protein
VSNRAQAPPGLLSDDEIYKIAEQIREAVRGNLCFTLGPDILSAKHELPTADEDRVITALEVLQLLAEVGP